MKLTNGYKVFFNHTEDCTHCEILVPNYAPAVGVARVWHKDQFNKAQGRKVALTRALRLFPREVRTDVWKSYFERMPLKRRSK